VTAQSLLSVYAGERRDEIVQPQTRMQRPKGNDVEATVILFESYEMLIRQAERPAQNDAVDAGVQRHRNGRSGMRAH